jgi:hypothetical protein
MAVPANERLVDLPSLDGGLAGSLTGSLAGSFTGGRSVLP